MRIDPRCWQIGTLASLLVYGMARLEFEISLARALLVIGAALATQLAGSRLMSCRFEWKSAAISSISLLLLLRTESHALHAAAAVIAVGSKFVIRAGEKHVFNPTNVAIVLMLLATERVWVSPGQWGSGAFFAFLMACAGGLVVNRAVRSDVTYAFLISYVVLVAGRALWLGDPLSIPFHKLQSGGLLLFAFFMISDPRTTPDHRLARIAFAIAVAVSGWYLQWRYFVPEGLLYALAAASIFVPLLDRVARGARYEWSQIAKALPKLPAASLNSKGEVMIRLFICCLSLMLFFVPDASAFCGFYVAKADARLFNKASQVVIARDGDRTVLTMANDYQGELRDFAIVIPVPTPIQKSQIRVAEPELIAHIDAYTSPRLVEYFDPDPCSVRYGAVAESITVQAGAPRAMDMSAKRARNLGVRIEAQYTVGEYDIVILSAEQSGGLVEWLKENGYRLPSGADSILGSYIRQNMKFFLAKVNLEEQRSLGFKNLRPLQVAFESHKFMLPIRLGTLNANGTQELFIYTLTRKGRVESTNYRTVKLPTGVEIPAYVKKDFGRFYRSLFDQQTKKHDMRVLFLEYAWDMNWCDPCAADPLSSAQLRKLGAFWIPRAPQSRDSAQAQNAFVTRLHLRYDARHFPEDLMFQETGNRENFQGRFVIRHAYAGDTSCSEGDQYWTDVAERQQKEVENLAELTGWDAREILRRANIRRVETRKWWEGLWE